MKIHCPFCDQEYELTREIAGQEVECPACGKSFNAPPMDEMTKEAKATRDLPPEPPTQPKDKTAPNEKTVVPRKH